MKEGIEDSIVHKLVTGEIINGFDYSKVILPDTLPNGMILLKGNMNEDGDLFTIYYKWNKIPELKPIKTKDFASELKELKFIPLKKAEKFTPEYYHEKGYYSSTIEDKTWDKGCKHVIHFGLSLSWALLILVILKKLFRR
jgi:hypothetical protein